MEFTDAAEFETSWGRRFNCVVAALIRQKLKLERPTAANDERRETPTARQVERLF